MSTVASTEPDLSLAVTQLRKVEDAYREICRPLTSEEWALRPQRTRYVDTVMRLTAGLQ